MNRRFRLWVAICLCLLLNLRITASAQDPTGGKLRGKLTDALAAVAKGNCPETLMSALLLDACEQQIDRMREALTKLGAIKELRYRGLEQLPTGVEAEVYRVVHANGQLTWMVAAGPNGKLTVFYTPG